MPTDNRHFFQNSEIWLPDKDTNLWGIPEVNGLLEVPKNVTYINSEFTKRIKDVDERKSTWVMFYEWDWKFDCYWRYPKRYAKYLQTFAGVITPQFSVYLDLPLALQIYSVYQSRWLGAYWESLGIPVIPDVSWGKEDSYDFCFSGLRKHSVIAIGNQYNSFPEIDLYYFQKGLDELYDRVEPSAVLYYGAKTAIPEKYPNIIQI